MPERGRAVEEELRVEPATHRVYVKGKEITPPLSREQYELLAHLHENAGKLCTREDIIRRVWPEVAAAGAARPLIVTVRGQGFRLDTE